MKILITGVSGFIGKNLVEFYQKDNIVITPMRGDDLLLSLNTNKPDVVIHCAAEIYKADAMFDSNIVMTYTILEWLKNNSNSKMIHIGSSSEYGILPRASKETDRINPIDIYQATKGAATLLCQGYARQFDLDVKIARVYSAYGNHERPNRLFPTLYRAFFNREPMNLYAGFHDFIYIKDFVRGINILVNSEKKPGEIINFGSGVQHSNLHVLYLWKHIYDSEPPIKYVDKMSKNFESTVWVCDTTYAKEKYSFETEYSLEEGIKEFIKLQNEKLRLVL
jgi:nucleoside-diphosphate-sugar epimerase